jgi:hypothetical protein
MVVVGVRARTDRRRVAGGVASPDKLHDRTRAIRAIREEQYAGTPWG